MAIKYPLNYSLGESKVHAFPKIQYAKIIEIIDAINALETSITTSDLSVTDDLTVGDDAAITGDLAVTGDTTLSGLLYLSGTPQTLTGAGAVNLTTKTTLLVTTGANALTLANSTVDGQVKIIIHKTDGGDGTLTPTTLRGGTTITFSAVGQTATLLWKDSSWNVIGLVGAVLA